MAYICLTQKCPFKPVILAIALQWVEFAVAKYISGNNLSTIEFFITAHR